MSQILARTIVAGEFVKEPSRHKPEIRRNFADSVESPWINWCICLKRFFYSSFHRWVIIFSCRAHRGYIYNCICPPPFVCSPWIPWNRLAHMLPFSCTSVCFPLSLFRSFLVIIFWTSLQILFQWLLLR